MAGTCISTHSIRMREECAAQQAFFSLWLATSAKTPQFASFSGTSPRPVSVAGEPVATKGFTPWPLSHLFNGFVRSPLYGFHGMDRFQGSAAA